MRKYPLLILLIITSLIVSVPGAFVSIKDMNFAYPAAAVMIQTIKNGQIGRVILPKGDGLPDRMMYKPEAEAGEGAGEAAGVSADAGSETDEASFGGVAAEGRDGKENGTRAEAAKKSSSGAAGTPSENAGEGVSSYSDAEPDPENEEEEGVEDETSDTDEDEEETAEEEWPKEFTTVSDNYFEDACFIGDSRVQGLGLYSELPATNYGVVGMQLYRVFDKKVINTDMGKVTIPEALAVEPKYGKIYMGFGLNEMGWGNDDMFAEYYYGLIDYLKAVQPDAVLYIMGLIHVTEGEERRSSVFNNEAVNHRNELLKEIAYNERIYYLDLNEVFTDEYGRLASEDSFDGIHIKANAISKWVDYLKTHAIE